MDDVIYTSAPVDKKAALVVSKGFEYEPNFRKTECYTESKLPLPTVAVRRGEPNYTGHKFGRFTVLGLAAKTNKAARGKWVVRCICGTYAYRKASSIKNAANACDCCTDCRHLLYLKRQEHHARTGKWKDVEEFF